ncbi:MAG TPA: pitrilysin family protein [Candidatus Moranbacteria bacterium]|nr:pitrilysin family protein [Candidatus Moranbacteria bacterium]
MRYSKKTLPNGLRVIAIPLQETETVTAIVAVGVGSRHEEGKAAGVAHFAEHMLFKGTQKRPSALAISEEMDALGAEINAFTGKERTMYYAKADARSLDNILDMLGDMYQNSLLEKDELEKEKGTILQELSMYEDAPQRSVGDLFEELLYDGHSLGREIIGSKETIRAMDRRKMARFLTQNYSGANTVVCVAGKISSAEVFRKTARIFKGVAKGSKRKFAKIKERQKETQIRIKHKETEQTHLVVGVRAFPDMHKDRFALGLLGIILGGNMSSRLFVEVREKRGLAYSIRTENDSYTDCGYLATQAGVKHEDAPEVVRLICQEYAKIAQEGVGEAELAKAKSYLRGRSVMGLETSDDVALFYAQQEIRRSSIMQLEEILAKYDAVTVKDIKRVARKIFSPERLNLALIGPHSATKQLAKELKL